MTLSFPNPSQIILVLVGASLLPYLAVLVTSFTKIIVVLGILRNALGLQSTPPNIALNGIAVILSLFIMQPVCLKTWELLKQQRVDWSTASFQEMEAVWRGISPPAIQFLRKNSQPEMRRFFIEIARRRWPRDQCNKLDEESLFILVPAFMLTELTAAFQIGFIIYLPFLVVDLVVSNILLALGIIMISPTAISLPFKLLLFIFVDGWTRLLDGLVMTYRL
ncbi:MAG: type III secretion system export apparatus subunit SctR [Candidatus Xiphinematobacter sp.]|nr:MAG: type III secretion system export apparatus subunit SctR [Candidatus Xiphinematobacter sp.]QQY08482.1 MAG: type III secretion system export apparatus subunit SctR [Candidatus Xiphinematobacter sp.]QQY09214.1 MAG: type III secretion system export apparatus subunit SctR [Candidatus Xiphinematobacter sp.]QQY10698.1 MAG: type III secretion system export apparatus subunit SctR [Candidatus Xiphinematobacter sp.]QQY11443.1 MAG: type III secretion system export apparatus subunit SctR [Candidatus